MTDLEITKACAEAMGYSSVERKGDEVHVMQSGFNIPGIYWPLEDDAQAMALVKRFPNECAKAIWDSTTTYSDLNRAICECVAKLHHAKLKEPA